jgi:hypothetical protein
MVVFPPRFPAVASLFSRLGAEFCRATLKDGGWLKLRHFIGSRQKIGR